MTIPKLPKWATDSGTVVEPSEGEKEAGWSVGTKPPARWMNWIHNQTYQSLAWLHNMLILSPLNNWQAVDNVGFAQVVSGQVRLAYADWDDKWVLLAYESVTPGSVISSGDSDLTAWAAEVAPVAGDIFYDVCHNGADLWVVAGQDVGTPDEAIIYTATTADGAWTDRRAVHAAFNDGLGSACYDATSGRYIFAADSLAQIGHTTDPTSVALTTVAVTSTFLTGIATDGDSNVVVVTGNGTLQVSADAGSTWGTSYNDVAMDSGTVNRLIWDSSNSRFMFAGRRASDDRLVVMVSPTGLTGSWTEYVVDALAVDAAVIPWDIAIGSRGEVVVSGVNSSGPFICGSATLDSWFGMEYPTIATPAGTDTVKAICQQNQSSTLRDHFWACIMTGASDATGDMVARTDTNIF